VQELRKGAGGVGAAPTNGGSGAGWLPLCCGWLVGSVRGKVSVMLLDRQSVDEGG